MVLDENERQLVTKNKKIELTKRECEILSYLIENRNRICSFKELALKIYDIDEEKYKYFKAPVKAIIENIIRKIKDEDLEIVKVKGYGIIINYKIDKKTRKRFQKMEKEIRIEQLKKEIFDRQLELTKLKRSLKK